MADVSPTPCLAFLAPQYEWADGPANQVLDSCREASIPVDEAFASLTAAKQDTEQQLLLILQSTLGRMLHARGDERALLHQLSPVLILSGLIVCTRGMAQSASALLRALHRLHQTYTSNELHAKVGTLVLGSNAAAAFASLESLELPDNLEGILDGQPSSSPNSSPGGGGQMDGAFWPAHQEEGEEEADDSSVEEARREQEQRDMAVVTSHSVEGLVEEGETDE